MQLGWGHPQAKRNGWPAPMVAAQMRWHLVLADGERLVEFKGSVPKPEIG